MNTWMRNIADDFAAQGYVALVPDLFWRLEPGVQINGEGEEDFAKAFDLYGRFDVEKGIADIQDSINALRGNHGASDKIGTVGFCLGGFLAYMCSVRTDANANVGYYGVGIDTMLGEQGNMKSPLILHVAVEDQFVPKEAQKKVHDGLAGNDKVTIYDYEGQDHAFARKGGDAYRKEAAELANRARSTSSSSTWPRHGQSIASGPLRRAGSAGIRRCRGRRSGAGRNSPAPRRDRRELHRHLSPGRHLSGLGLSAHSRRRGRRGSHRRRRRGDHGQGRRSGVLPAGPGAYCEERLINAGMVVPVPDGISDDQAAAAITKGITVHHLYTRVRQVGAGDWVLFHAAAGGVGLFACQWAKHIGAKLIGTVSSDAKAQLARDNGAAETIDYTQEDFVERVKDITGGEGVALVVDGIGGDNPTKSAQCLAAYGTLTTIGQASGRRR